MVLKNIPLSRIVADTTYRYRLHEASPALRRAIQQRGVRQPLVGFQTATGIQLTDGFLRWELAQAFQWTEVPVTVHPDAASAFVESVYVNHSQSPLSVVEKALVVAIGKKILDSAAFQEVIQFLEIPTERQVKLLLEIATYPEVARLYFHEQQFSLKQIERLRSVKVENLLPWIELARDLRMKAPEFQQVIEMVWDISVREECSIETCFHRLQIEQFLKPEWTVQQKVQRLKQYLFEHRYPLLHTLRKKLEQQATHLQKISPLPLRIQWDKNLEDMGIWLQFYLEDWDKLNVLAKLLKNPEFAKSLKQYFEIFTQTKE